MPDVNELINALRELFYGKCNSDKRLQSIAQKLAEGTYSDAHDYSVRVGELLSEAFSEVLTEEIYPELTQEIARQIIPSLLGSDHRMISDACVTVQEHLNQNAGIGLKPIEPEFNASRAYDLADKYVSYDEHEKAEWVLGEPVENFSQSVVDDSIRRNAKFHAKVGMSPKIIRKAEPPGYKTITRGKRKITYKVPCDWCLSLAKTYNYSDVCNTGNNVWRRHPNCRCTVLYDPGDGRKQDVWSKKWIESVDNRQLRFKLDIQFFGGKERRDHHERKWQKGSLSDTIQKFIPDAKVKSENDNKKIFASDKSRYMIIYDKNGDYFRIMDLHSKEKGERKYVGIDGKDVNYYTDDEGNAQLISINKLRELTHFLNTDLISKG